MSEYIPHLYTNLLDDKQLHLPKGVKLCISVEDPIKPKYTEKPSFIMVGNGMSSKKYTSYPLLETLSVLNPKDGWFFNILLKAHNQKTGYSTLTNPFTPSEKVAASKAYKTLNNIDLVRKVKRQVYMINPSAIITNQWKEHIKIWESLAPKPPKVFTYINPRYLPKGFWIKSYKAYKRGTGTYNKP
ncbi:hypothetical protein [uncultured Flavobacterium sp.]|uniref:hypothetical protein n=1 Tax=uncultured Flavobacterium sp. TaxID=165435 RepID=UPI002599EE9F|nr:hypothetical protein [uncultured Flavobacterium sp.]